MALTFFAFLGFGIVTFTAKDLGDPARELPKAMYLALGIASVVYVAVSLGVFGTLTVEQVIASGGTAIAVAAEPVLGQAGYWYDAWWRCSRPPGRPTPDSTLRRAYATSSWRPKQFPPVMARKFAGRASAGLLIVSLVCIALVVGFDLNAIASIGSAVALAVFGLVTVAHLRVRSETGASLTLLILAVLTCGIALVAFLISTIINDPGSVIAMLVIVLIGVIADLTWKRVRASRHRAEPPAPARPTTDPPNLEPGGAATSGP